MKKCTYLLVWYLDVGFDIKRFVLWILFSLTRYDQLFIYCYINKGQSNLTLGYTMIIYLWDVMCTCYV